MKKKKKHEDITKSYKQRAKKFRCPFCDKCFDKSQALGGHKSKVHPGMSQSYIAKKMVRQRREIERKILAKAKEIYRETIGSSIFFRGRLNEIKN